MIKKNSLSSYDRAGCRNPTAGLDFPRGVSGQVCQQVSQWASHHGWPLPAELGVGSEWSAGFKKKRIEWNSNFLGQNRSDDVSVSLFDCIVKKNKISSYHEASK